MSKMKNFLKFKTGGAGHDMRKFGEEFYLREARLWRPFRWAGMLSTILAMVLTMASIFNENWIYGKGAYLLHLRSLVLFIILTKANRSAIRTQE